MALFLISGVSNAYSAPLESAYITLKSRKNTNKIDAFRTDGCTQAPDSWWGMDKTPWDHCCLEHDVAHWAGGSAEKRLAADTRLGLCMDKVGGPGRVFFRMVRIFGHPAALPLDAKLSTRNYPWGYGWNHYQGHDPLNEKQSESICKELEAWQQTEAFQNFEETYRLLQGEDPVIPNCQ